MKRRYLVCNTRLTSARNHMKSTLPTLNPLAHLNGTRRVSGTRRRTITRHNVFSRHNSFQIRSIHLRQQGRRRHISNFLTDRPLRVLVHLQVTIRRRVIRSTRNIHRVNKVTDLVRTTARLFHGVSRTIRQVTDTMSVKFRQHMTRQQLHLSRRRRR